MEKYLIQAAKVLRDHFTPCILLQITDVSCTGYSNMPPGKGAVQCLADGDAHVAFVTLTNLTQALNDAGLTQVGVKT
jgi:hypothetical protein